ncbi:MAG: hypothetical protein M3Q93_03310 [Gemmatimonadota bacterium]|nr:hypothetical protein [Gemmatimonadota bacterium]
MVATCFALSATSWGRPRDCTSHTAGHGGEARHEHSQDQQPAPAEHACAIHLCCAHVAPQTAAGLAAEQAGELAADAGFTASRAVAPARAAHTLPFAHAPPA